MESLRRHLLLFIKGIGIGCADIVPGISGGTVAFITGIYAELLSAIQAFDLTAFRLLRRGQFKALWGHLHGSFLLPLLSGIGLSLITAVQSVVYLLAYYPVQTWSFFGGLLLGSTFIIYQRIKHWHLQTLLISLGGLVLAYGITQATPLHTPNTSWFVGLAGAISVCAMILPGISGSFVLLLLGKYTFMLNALKDFELDTLVSFSLGGVVGLLSFSRLIAWLLRQHHDNTLALLAGFMLGSLNKVGPWEQLWHFLSLGTDSFRVGQNYSLSQLQTIFHQNSLASQALLWMSLGMLLMAGMERQARGQR
jgi:putative membrane protein